MTPARRYLLAAGMCMGGYVLRAPDAQAQAVSAEEMARCAALAADAERLACYDRLAHASAHAPATAPVPAAPPAERPDQSFGIVKPPAIKRQEPSRMEARILTVTDSHGGAVVQLDNDQTWMIDDGPAILRAGDTIVIKRAALGSFLMTTPTHRVYRVTRLK